MTKVSSEDTEKARAAVQDVVEKGQRAVIRGFRLIAATPVVVGVAWAVAPIPVPLLAAVAVLWLMQVAFVAVMMLLVAITKIGQVTP